MHLDMYSINTPYCYREGYVFSNQQRKIVAGTLTYMYTGNVAPPNLPEDSRLYTVLTESEKLPTCPDLMVGEPGGCGCTLLSDVLVECPGKGTCRHKLTYSCLEDGKSSLVVEYTECLPKAPPVD